MTPRVVIAATTWAVNGVNVFSTNLTRGLIAAGIPAHIVLTEDTTGLVTSTERLMPYPADVPFQSLPVSPIDGWGTHWGAMLGLLEQAAPCVYIPNYDWRHSCICPRLPDTVVVVGVVHSDDPLHYHHVRRLGHTWNAVVAVSDAVADRTREACPGIADRLVTIPTGVPVPDSRPVRLQHGGPLRVVYHGALKQHQKRVLDLPRIVEAAAAAGVDLVLTIAGAGPDEGTLRTAAAPLVARGLVRFAGIVPPDDTGALLDTQDVYLLASEFEGMPNALIEAMGHGCVPIVTRMTSGIPELVRHDENGFLVPIGDTAAFAERLAWLAADRARLDRLSAAAFDTVRRSRFRVDDMVGAYRRVFDDAWADVRAGRFHRPSGPISPPPAEVAGVRLFPVDLPHVVPELGAFPSADDAEEFDAARRAAPGRTAALPPGPRNATGITTDRDTLRGLPVFVAAPVWTATGVNAWSEDLVRGLRASDLDARLLLSEESTRLITIGDPRMARPSDLPTDEMVLGDRDGWGARWGTMVRLLESAAPCVYVPSYDWRHASVVPALSDRVVVLGVLHDSGPLYTEQATRLGDCWNGAVATSLDTARHVRRHLPALGTRLTAIPHGTLIPPSLPAKPAVAPLSVLLLAENLSADLIERLAAALGETSDADGHVRWTIVGEAPETTEPGRANLPQRLVRPNRQQWIDACLQAHVVVIERVTGGTRRMLFEAMGHGCVPLWVGAEPPDASLLIEQQSALAAPDGDAAVARLRALVADPTTLGRLASGAHAAARRDAGYRTDQMIDAYLDLLVRLRHEADSGEYRRPRGPLRPPPAAVDGHDILPVAFDYTTSAGPFPTRHDARRFDRESRVPATRRWSWPWR